jgi:hypothetical protein
MPAPLSCACACACTIPAWPGRPPAARLSRQPSERAAAPRRRSQRQRRRRAQRRALPTPAGAPSFAGASACGAAHPHAVRCALPVGFCCVADTVLYAWPCAQVCLGSRGPPRVPALAGAVRSQLACLLPLQAVGATTTRRPARLAARLTLGAPLPRGCAPLPTAATAATAAMAAMATAAMTMAAACMLSRASRPGTPGTASLLRRPATRPPTTAAATRLARAPAGAAESRAAPSSLQSGAGAAAWPPSQRTDLVACCRMRAATPAVAPRSAGGWTTATARGRSRAAREPTVGATPRMEASQAGGGVGSWRGCSARTLPTGPRHHGERIAPRCLPPAPCRHRCGGPRRAAASKAGSAASARRPGGPGASRAPGSGRAARLGSSGACALWPHRGPAAGDARPGGPGCHAGAAHGEQGRPRRVAVLRSGLAAAASARGGSSPSPCSALSAGVCGDVCLL